MVSSGPAKAKVKTSYPTRVMWSYLKREDEDGDVFIPLAHERLFTVMHALRAAGIDRDRTRENLHIPFKQMMLANVSRNDANGIANLLMDFAISNIDWNYLLDRARAFNRRKAAKEADARKAKGATTA